MTIRCYIQKHRIETRDAMDLVVPPFPYRLCHDTEMPTVIGQSLDKQISVALFAGSGRFVVIKTTPAQRFEGTLVGDYPALDVLD